MMLYNAVGFYSLTKREVMRFMKVWSQTLLMPLITNLLFLGVFGAIFLDRDIGIEGVSYLVFLVPGLCAMGAISNAFQNPSSSLIIQKYQNILQDLNAYPITAFEKTAAYIIGGVIRGVLVGALTYAATIPFVGFTIEHPVLFFFMLAVISAVFSAFGLIAGLMSKSFDQVSFIGNIVLTPLLYFGGVFFQLSNLPKIVSVIAMFNPVFPLIDMTRYAYAGIYEGSFIYNSVFILVLLVGLFVTSYMLFRKGVGLKD